MAASTNGKSLDPREKDVGVLISLRENFDGENLRHIEAFSSLLPTKIPNCHFSPTKFTVLSFPLNYIVQMKWFPLLARKQIL